MTRSLIECETHDEDTATWQGSGKFDVGVHDMGGWVRVIAGGTAPQDGNLPFYLAHRLSQWFRENAHLRLLCVVPISKDGNTVELHAWYEQHVFRDISPLAQQPGEKPEE